MILNPGTELSETTAIKVPVKSADKQPSDKKTENHETVRRYMTLLCSGIFSVMGGVSACVITKSITATAVTAATLCVVCGACGYKVCKCKNSSSHAYFSLGDKAKPFVDEYRAAVAAAAKEALKPTNVAVNRL